MKTDLWTEFINSDRHDHLGVGRDLDELDDSHWLACFLARWGLEVPPGLREPIVRSLKKLRHVLQRVAEEISSGRALSPGHVTELNRYLKCSLLTRRLDFARGRGQIALEPVRRTAAFVLAEIVHSFAHTVADGEVSRIKKCGNPDCRWFFYDFSKNKTRKWCESTCGSLMKVRRFRQKHRRGQR